MLPQRTRAKASLSQRESHTVGPVHFPSLELSCNGQVQQKFSIDCPRFLIGRAKGNDIPVPSDYVSRYHIMLIRHQGYTILIDLQSTNGTFVNSELVANHVLADGDEIAIDHHCMFNQFSVKYCDPDATPGVVLDDIANADEAIEKGLEEVSERLGIKTSDLSPTLRINQPLKKAYIDDR